MKKDFTRDYATEAFRMYAAMNKPTYEEAAKMIYDKALKECEFQNPELANLAAESAVTKATPTLLDIMAVEKTISVGKVSKLSLPRLAKGTVLTKATPVIAGEDGAEAIMPLEKHTAWIDVLANKITKAMYNGQMPQPKAAPAVNTNLGGLNFTIEKFENHTDKDLRELMGEAMEVAEEYIKRRGGAFA